MKLWRVTLYYNYYTAVSPVAIVAAENEGQARRLTDEQCARCGPFKPNKVSCEEIIIENYQDSKILCLGYSGLEEEKVKSKLAKQVI